MIRLIKKLFTWLFRQSIPDKPKEISIEEQPVDIKILLAEAYANGVEDTLVKLAKNEDVELDMETIEAFAKLPQRVQVALNHTMYNLDFITVTEIYKMLNWKVESGIPSLPPRHPTVKDLEIIASELLLLCYNKFVTAPDYYNKNLEWSADEWSGGFSAQYWENAYGYPNFSLLFVPVFAYDMTKIKNVTEKATPPPRDERDRSGRRWNNRRPSIYGQKATTFDSGPDQPISPPKSSDIS